MASDLEKRLAPLTTTPAGELLINEIFASIQGESSHAGRPCTFVRTTGCNLRCRYCDTAYAFTDGKRLSPADVVAEVRRLGLPLIEITGGEPLLQPAILPLMTALCDGGYTVMLETSGSIDIRPVDPRVVKIVDLKTPGSGEAGGNLYANIEALGPHDELKLVLVNRADYDWAREKLLELRLAERCTVLLSAAFGRLDPRDLAGWIVSDRLPVRMQLQLHKYIWDPRARGV